MPKIGDTVWWFNENRRVYHRNDEGRPTGSPIYREHFEQLEILGETKQSWIIGCPGDTKGRKFKKIDTRDLCFTIEELQDRVYVKENQFKIADKIRSCKDANVLKAVETALKGRMVLQFNIIEAFAAIRNTGHLITLAQEPTGVLMELGYTNKDGSHHLEISEIHSDEEEAIKSALEHLGIKS